MEKFNIEEFESRKIAGEYNRTLDDGTQINQFGDSTSGYFEKVIPPKGWYYLYKEFYGNGNLKSKGNLFKKGDYKSGIWVECDTFGIKTSEQNFDAIYTLNLDSVLKILSEQGIKFTLTDPFNKIRRNVVDKKAIWFIEWKVAPSRIERMQIDDATGKVILKTFYNYAEDH